MPIDIDKKVKLYSYQEFKELGKLSLLNEGNSFLSLLEDNNGKNHIALIEDDIDADMLKTDELFDAIRKHFSIPSTEFPQAIWFSGKVTIKNSLFTKELSHYSNALIFEGSFESKNVIMGGTELHFLKKLAIHHVFYYQIRAQGIWSNAADSSVHVEVDNNQTYKNSSGKFYDFSDMSEELTAENLDLFFVNKDDFFTIDDDYEAEDDTAVADTPYYGLEEDEALVSALLDGSTVFK